MERPVTTAAQRDAIARDPKPLVHRDFGGCRWPLDRFTPQGDRLFCCNGRNSTEVYCTEHMRIAHTKDRYPKASADVGRWPR